MGGGPLAVEAHDGVHDAPVLATGHLGLLQSGGEAGGRGGLEDLGHDGTADLVVDVMEDGGTSYALLNMSGEQVWIQVGALKELKPGEPGIPDAPKRPLPQPVKEAKPEAKPQPLAPQPQLEVLERLGKIEEQGKKNNALLQFIIDVLKAVFRVK